MIKKLFLSSYEGTDTSPDWFTWLAYGNNLLYIILILVIWFCTGIIMAYWVYKDLKKREHKSTAYLVIILFTNIIGLAFYLFARYNEKCLLEDEIKCGETEDMEYIEHFEKDLKEEVDEEIDNIDI
ncbi:MAG: hypothetical protein EAX89_15380 [Candidatus Lokiarchaeota archaeon]|nr:hypothetical protein [Candidatus Lokiarchaeota archaeon]